jgi:hypothetical protein
MQHDDIAGRADLGGAAVIERLHADVGPADGVGVVTMRVEAMPGEPGFEELHAVRERSAAQPVGRRRPARSFKTRPTVAAYRLLDHESAPIRIMTSEQVVGFLLFAVAAAGTPGPSNLLLTETGATVGVVRGLPCLLGVSIGMGVMMFVVAFGLGSLVLANPTVLRLLSWLGALVLLRIAWQIAAARGGAPVGARRPVGFIGAAAGDRTGRKGAARPYRIMLGSQSESHGKATSSARRSTSAHMNGMTPRKTVPVDTSGSSVLRTKRFMPTGGLMSPISTTQTMMTPNQTGSTPSCTTTGKNTGIVSRIIDSSSMAVPRAT